MDVILLILATRSRLNFQSSAYLNLFQYLFCNISATVFITTFIFICQHSFRKICENGFLLGIKILGSSNFVQRLKILRNRIFYVFTGSNLLIIIIKYLNLSSSCSVLKVVTTNTRTFTHNFIQNKFSDHVQYTWKKRKYLVEKC